MVRVLISFAAGNPDILDALNRITKQAKDTNMFDEIYGFTENDLKQDKEFWKINSDFIQKNQRGFGYWIWKPYLIQKKLNEMKDGDILTYIDAGCEIKVSEKDLLHKYFHIIETDLIIATDTGQKEEAWVKADLLYMLNMYDEKYFTTQRQATVIMIKKTDETIKLVNEWYSIAIDNNYHNIDDTPSIKANHSSFKEHRHDQSIFSLLTKKYGIYSSETLGPPFYLLRNRTGKTIIEGFTESIHFNWIFFIIIIVLFCIIVLCFFNKSIRRFIYNLFAQPN
jgi:hypothetical protein